MIVILYYSNNNTNSVFKAVSLVAGGRQVAVSNRIDHIVQASHLVIPGVGSFAEGMKYFSRPDIKAAVREAIEQRRVATLGICLGAELLSRGSDEFGEHRGLGYFPMAVTRLRGEGMLRVPHIGWNTVAPSPGEPLFAGIPATAQFYFAHSHCCKELGAECVGGTTAYGEIFHSYFRRGRVCGVQFHPELSGEPGQQLLANFLGQTGGAA